MSFLEEHEKMTNKPALQPVDASHTSVRGVQGIQGVQGKLLWVGITTDPTDVRSLHDGAAEVTEVTLNRLTVTTNPSSASKYLESIGKAFPKAHLQQLLSVGSYLLIRFQVHHQDVDFDPTRHAPYTG